MRKGMIMTKYSTVMETISIYFFPRTQNLDVVIITKSSINSSIERELMYIADHAIHHGHIIQLFIKNHYPSDYNNIEFYSPSTLNHTQCVK